MRNKHIEIISLKDCCGCSACSSICPKHCISLQADKFGLNYPQVELSQCIECGLCRKVCPVINSPSHTDEVESYAAINKNEVNRVESSSGGVFIELATQVISKNGVVFGAVFDKDWSVYHCHAETIQEVIPMMRSKYLQSDVRKTYIEAKNFLDSGKTVMYTGTPCQIAGLHNYLRKDYDNLLLVEVICHGVPAPAIWQSYLREKCSELDTEHITVSNDQRELPITEINFRSKRKSWKRYNFDLLIESPMAIKKGSDSTSTMTCPRLYSESFTDNEYMKAFLRNWSLRPSCYECKVKSGKSGADLTIGDFWGIKKTDIIEDDDKGVSCVICWTDKGRKWVNECSNLNLIETKYQTILQGNPSIEKSVSLTNEALRFQRLFSKHGFSLAMSKTEHPSLLFRGINYIKRHLHNGFN